MSNNKIWTIYKHTAPNGMAYIGCTSSSWEQRSGRKSGCNYKNQGHFWSAIQEFKWKNFKHEILLTVGTKEMARKAEEAMIIGYNTLWPNGYNERIGYQNSTNMRKKMSESQKRLHLNGYVSPNKGRKMSEETRRKLSEACKGKPAPWNSYKRPIEYGRKISERRAGTHWYTNGIEDRLCRECPEGFYPGRIYKRKTSTN